MIANVIRANHRSNKTIPTVLIKNARSALSYGFNIGKNLKILVNLSYKNMVILYAHTRPSPMNFENDSKCIRHKFDSLIWCW